MASKRKCTVPMKFSKAKRNRMSWCSPFERSTSKLNKALVQNDDEFLELEDYEQSLSQQVPTKSPRKFSKKQNIDDHSSKIVKNCTFYLKVLSEVPTASRTLATFQVWPAEASESMNDLFHFLIGTATKFWVYVDEVCDVQYAFLQLSDFLSKTKADAAILSSTANSLCEPSLTTLDGDIFNTSKNNKTTLTVCYHNVSFNI